MVEKVTFIGFGEASGAIIEGWASNGPSSIKTYDRKTDNAETRNAILARAQSLGVAATSSNADAVARAHVILSFVTADQASNAALETAESIAEGALFLDCNSCAPETKRANAVTIEAAGGRYVDVAVMAPIYPAMHKAPCLISGPHTEATLIAMTTLGMNARAVGDEIGKASSIKMIRSVMIKGIEAVIAECVLSGCAAGVEEEVIASVQKSFPGIEWRDKSAYDMERMIIHGTRRASEMREVAKTVSDLGLPNAMSSATITWQDKIGDLGIDRGTNDYQLRARNIIAALKEE